MEERIAVSFPYDIKCLSDDEGGGYLVEVPELPGCAAVNSTIPGAIADATAALEAWVKVAVKCGRKWRKHNLTTRSVLGARALYLMLSREELAVLEG